MSSTTETHAKCEATAEMGTCPCGQIDAHISAFQGLGWLDRLLALWILLAMIVGILLGNFVKDIGPALQRGTFVGVSIPIGTFLDHHISSVRLTRGTAIGLLVMMYPILCKVKYETLHQMMRQRTFWIQLAVSIVMNWLVAPFLMVRYPDLARRLYSLLISL